MNVSRLSVLLPPRPPTRMDLFSVALGLYILATEFPLNQSSGAGIMWPIAVVMFVLVVLTSGPAARSSLGQSFTQWFQDIGYGGRLLVVVSAMAMMAIVLLTLPVPGQAVDGFFIGLISSVVVVVSANYLHAKTVGRPKAA